MHPGTVLALLELAGRGIAVGEQRRGEVEFELVVALELRAELLQELAVGVEPRRPRTRPCRPSACRATWRTASASPRRPGAFSFSAAGDLARRSALVARGVGLVLIGGQQLDPLGDDLRRACAPPASRRAASAWRPPARRRGRGRRSRPQAKVRLLVSTATPFSSMARSMRLEDSGTKALLPGIAQHEEVGGDRIAQDRRGEAGAIDEGRGLGARGSPIDFIIASAPRSMSPFMTNAADGLAWPLITAWVMPGSTRDSAAGAAATTRSQPSTRLAPPAPMRTACSVLRLRARAAHGSSPRRPSGPCRLKSSTVHALAFDMGRHAHDRADGDHAGAADAGDQHAVRRSSAAAGQGRRQAAAAVRPCATPDLSSALPFLTPPPSTVTKLGQKPLRQEKSLLQELLVDRALAAELGLDRLTDTRQFDLGRSSRRSLRTPRSLMNTRLAGSG